MYKSSTNPICTVIFVLSPDCQNIAISFEHTVLKNKTEKHVTKVITTRWSTYVIIDKEDLTTLIHTVANVNICDRRLLRLVTFWKLWITVVHVDMTFKCLSANMSQLLLMDTFKQKGITQNRKTFITQPKRLRFR